MNHLYTFLKKSFLLIPFIAISFASRSQDFPFVKLINPGTANQLNIQVPDGITTRIFSGANSVNPLTNNYSIWLEIGDGNYLSTFSNGLENIPTTSLKTNPYLLASSLYDERRRPPTNGSSTSYSETRTFDPGLMSSPLLEGTSKQIILFSNVREIVDNDRMVFGISYIPDNLKNDTSTRYKVIFRYNSQNQTAFVPITSGIQTSVVPDYSIAAADPIQLPDIRRFSNENIHIGGTAAELNNFSDAIVFDNIKHSAQVRNIFISLLPLNIYPGSTSMETEILFQVKESGEWRRLDIHTKENIPSAYAHDPNSISVSPGCLQLPRTNQKLHYTIQFQNTGEGNATAVKVVFYFPQQMNRSKQIENTKISYSGYDDLGPADIFYDYAKGRVIFTVNFDPGHNLSGAGVPNAVTNPLTMGQISFDLELLPGSNVNQSDIMEAWAEIYMRGESASPDSVNSDMISRGLCIEGTTGFEMPVRTNNAIAIYSSCCRANPPCKCSHPRGIWQWLLCYWWIIVIILLIFVIWWLYRRIRHHG